MKPTKYVLALAAALIALLTPGALLADTITTYNFSGTLTTTFNGSNTVKGQFTLDVASPTTATITAYNFTTPDGIYSGGTDAVSSYLALSPVAYFTTMDFWPANGAFLQLDFETTLSPFDGTTFYTDPIFFLLPGWYNHAELQCTGFDVGCLAPPTGGIGLFASGEATAVTPEPAPILLLGNGLLGLLGMGLRRKRLV
jgi:hypothetical protein